MSYCCNTFFLLETSHVTKRDILQICSIMLKGLVYRSLIVIYMFNSSYVMEVLV